MLPPVKLIGRAASTAAHTVRHPISSVAYAAGIARGLAGAVLPGSSASDRHTAGAAVPPQRTAAKQGPGHESGHESGQESGQPVGTREPEAPAGPRKPQVVPKPVPPPDAEFDTIVIEAADQEPGEAFATEPKAVSRESAHGGPATTDAEVDAWDDDWDDDARDEEGQVRTPAGTTRADVAHDPHTGEPDLHQPGTTPLLDPSLAKAIRSESEMLRRDAEVDPS